MNDRSELAITATLCLLPIALQAQAVKVDPGVASYQPTSGVSGSLKSIGSD